MNTDDNRDFIYDVTDIIGNDNDDNIIKEKDHSKIGTDFIRGFCAVPFNTDEDIYSKMLKNKSNISILSKINNIEENFRRLSKELQLEVENLFLEVYNCLNNKHEFSLRCFIEKNLLAGIPFNDLAIAIINSLPYFIVEENNFNDKIYRKNPDINFDKECNNFIKIMRIEADKVSFNYNERKDIMDLINNTNQINDNLNGDSDNSEYNRLLDIMLSDLDNMNKNENENISFSNELNDIDNVCTFDELKIVPVIKNSGTFFDGVYYSYNNSIDNIELISIDDKNDNKFSNSLEWFCSLKNNVKIAVKKGFIHIISILIEADVYDKSALHQFFIDQINSGEIKLPKNVDNKNFRLSILDCLKKIDTIEFEVNSIKKRRKGILTNDFVTECEIILDEMEKNIEKIVKIENTVINDCSDNNNDKFSISLEWFYPLENEVKYAVMKGFIQILSCLSQEEDISKKICNISKLHQFFIDNIKSGEMKLSKIFVDVKSYKKFIMDCLKKIPLIIFDEVLIKIRNIKDSFVKFSSQCNIIINEMNSLLGGDNEIIKTVKKNLIRKENLNIDPFTEWDNNNLDHRLKIALKQGFVVLIHNINNGSNLSLPAYEKILFKKINAGELILPIQTLSKNVITNITMYIKIIFDELLKFPQFNIEVLYGISYFIQNPVLSDKEFKKQCIKVIEKMDDYIVNKIDNNSASRNIETNEINNSKETNSLKIPVKIEDRNVVNNLEHKVRLFDFDNAMRSDDDDVYNFNNNKISKDNNKDIFEKYYNNDIDNIIDFANNSILYDGNFVNSNKNKLEYGYLGKLINNNRQFDFLTDDLHDEQQQLNKNVFLNVNKPFCMLCIGVQGAGKSHSLNIVLENCLINCPYPNSTPLIQLYQPMCGLVLHYDQCETNICESTGLTKLSELLINSKTSLKSVKKVVVLVSPSYYKQRKNFYGDSVEVRPLLFKWSTLSAHHLKKLMRISETDSQVYVSVILDLLRGYQRNGIIPIFESFCQVVKSKCTVSGQNAQLIQRLQLLENIIFESVYNNTLQSEQVSLCDFMESGTLVVADLTDPMLTSDEANGIFQVLLEQFRNHHLKGCGKIVVFDEAHKYLDNSSKDGLARLILESVRLMRHEGIRILISTQSPLTIPSELLELVTITVLHHFQSDDWYRYLSSKISMPTDCFNTIKSLQPGQALIVTTKYNIEGYSIDDHLLVKIRDRITTDRGVSLVNKKKKIIFRY